MSESVREEVFRFLGAGPAADVAIACVAESLELPRLVSLNRAGAGPNAEGAEDAAACTGMGGSCTDSSWLCRVSWMCGHVGADALGAIWIRTWLVAGVRGPAVVGPDFNDWTRGAVPLICGIFSDEIGDIENLGIRHVWHSKFFKILHLLNLGI